LRAPHHPSAQAGLVGGGNWPQPGEISLAHRGVLFLDELPEFGSRVLEVMRQPMEDKIVTISRAQGALTFPANFQLVAAMNPCPGGRGCAHGACGCTRAERRRYLGRLSGPLLDRIDLHVRVAPLPAEELLADAPVQLDDAAIPRRVGAARARQLARAGRLNRDLSGSALESACALTGGDRSLLTRAAERLGLSARSCHRVLRVARSIADLEGSAQVRSSDLTEALSFRALDQPPDM
jgi:magnesium chelatase family protein